MCHFKLATIDYNVGKLNVSLYIYRCQNLVIPAHTDHSCISSALYERTYVSVVTIYFLNWRHIPHKQRVFLLYGRTDGYVEQSDG